MQSRIAGAEIVAGERDMLGQTILAGLGALGARHRLVGRSREAAACGGRALALGENGNGGGENEAGKQEGETRSSEHLRQSDENKIRTQSNLFRNRSLTLVSSITARLYSSGASTIGS